MTCPHTSGISSNDRCLNCGASLDPATRMPPEADKVVDWDEAFMELVEATADSDTPETIARTKAKAQAEFDKGVRLGWWTQDGTILPQPDDDDDDDGDDPGEL